MNGSTKAVWVAACAGLATGAAQGGVLGLAWVEVDNSVSTMGDVAGTPTGLDGVRTFDLYALVTPDTRLYAADFGFVGSHQGYDDNMWTTQSVYQSEFGGDVQSGAIGMAPMLAALEFDTYVGLGMLSSTIVMNTSILSVSWSPSGFEGAWYGIEYTADAWIPAVGDDEGKVFLARISVSSEGAYGEATGDTEWLGGRVFVSGDDDLGEIGQNDPASGLFLAPNAFDTGAAATIAASIGQGSSGDEPDETVVLGDLNGDGVVTTEDLLLMQSEFGVPGSEMDLNHDGIVDALDVEIMVGLLNGTVTINPGADAAPEDPTEGMTPKEKKRYEKALRKSAKDAEKAAKRREMARKKELKRQEKERRKEQKRLEKERRKQAKQNR